MNGFTFDPERESPGRWGLAAALVVGVHAAVLAVVMARHALIKDLPPPEPVAMIDLAPLPPPPIPEPPPPVVQPPPPEPPPPPPPQIVEPPPQPPPPVLEPPKPEAVQEPVKPPPPKPRPRPIKPPPPQPVPQVVQQPQPQVVTPQPIEPAPAPRPAFHPDAAPNWQALVMARLHDRLIYPRLADERHQVGVATVEITLNRSGTVLGVKMVKSTGFQLLDQEALAVVARSNPFQPPPPEQAGDPITLTLQVQFVPKR